MKISDTVLLYAPKNSAKALRMKPSILRTGARIKMVAAEQFSMTIGELLGMSEEEVTEFASQAKIQDENAGHLVTVNPEELEALGSLQEEVLVMWNFTGPKIDEMLNNFRKAGVSKIALKAIVTPNNVKWTFAQLIRELQKEHSAYQEI